MGEKREFLNCAGLQRCLKVRPPPKGARDG